VQGRVANVNDITDRLINSYGAMAGRLAAIESQRTVIDETTLRIDELLIREDDLDYAKAVTELSQESVALQALQASFVKVAQLSLFNFLR
jgi:flagellar hook-associated protein 3 FlgL